MTHTKKPDTPDVVSGLDLIDKAAVSKKLNRTPRAVEALQHRDPSFPRPRRWGKNCVWLAADVDAWIKAQFAETEEENAARLKTKGGAT